MTHAPTARPQDLRFTLDQAIAAHGARRVLFAALRALLQPPPAKRHAASDRALSDHLRRDIGLTPSATSPPDWMRHL